MVNPKIVEETPIGFAEIKSELAKINLIVKSDDMLTIETIHLLVCHLITTIIRSEGTPKFTY